METDIEVARGFGEALPVEAAPPAKRPRVSGTVRGALLMVSATFIVAVLNYALNIVLGWSLPVEQYGRVGVSQTIIFVCVWFLGAGFPWVVTRAIAQARGARPDDDAEGEVAWRTYKTAWVANILLTLAIVGLLLGAFYTRVLPLETTYEPLIIIAAATIAALGIGAVPDAGLQGLFRFGRISVVRVAEATANIVLSVLLIIMGFAAPGALAGFALAAVLAGGMNIYFIRDKQFWLAKGWGGLSTVREALPMTLAVFGGVLLTNVDLLAIKFLTGSQSDALSGTYQVAAVLARAPFFVGTALVSTFYPRIAQDASEGRAGASGQELLRWLALAVLPMNTILLFAAPAVVAFFFPARYHGAQASLAVLAAGSGFLVLASAFAAVLQASGAAKVAAGIMTISVATQIVGLAVLVPAFGTMGAAASSAGASALAFALLSWTGHRLGWVPPGVIRQMAALAMLALLVMPLLFFSGAPRAVVALWVAGAIIAYIISLFILNLLRANELEEALNLPEGSVADRLARRLLGIAARLNSLAPGSRGKIN